MVQRDRPKPSQGFASKMNIQGQSEQWKQVCFPIWVEKLTFSPLPFSLPKINKLQIITILKKNKPKSIDHSDSIIHTFHKIATIIQVCYSLWGLYLSPFSCTIWPLKPFKEIIQQINGCNSCLFPYLFSKYKMLWHALILRHVSRLLCSSLKMIPASHF